MLRTASFALFIGALLLLSLLASALPHDDEHGSMDMHGEMGVPDEPSATPSPVVDGDNRPLMSYFSYKKHSSSIVAHIVLMTLAWFFILPTGVMFSVARSRLALPTQFVFLVVNALGLLLGIVYNSQTPDLYENNVHHKIGWIASWVMGAQVLMALLFTYSGRDKYCQGFSDERVAFLPLSSDGMHGAQSNPNDTIPEYRWSGDSGQGTERSSSSFHSRHSSPERSQRISRSLESEDLTEKPEPEVPQRGPRRSRFFLGTILDKFFSRRIPGLVPKRVVGGMRVAYIVIERLILILGFIAVVTGGVIYSGIFRGNDIFNGLAHFIKGGIFFWYGLFTLGRWMGCFSELGWAWNTKPSRAMVGKWKAMAPTAEFTESFLIFLYGSTNVFLEHLAAWGEAWAPQDLEHVSISIMFFGGGLCGMLVESQRICDWVNASLKSQSYHIDEYPPDAVLWQPPKSQRVSLNPMPALIILLLGLMMSSHHQATMVSTMVHKQWGMLLLGSALSRAVTYILIYLNPPASFLPSRPPSEVVAAFCLISGGLIFMLSTRDIIQVMVKYDLNAMFVFTVGMGFTAFIMAWEMTLLSLKAWSSERGTAPPTTDSQYSA